MVFPSQTENRRRPERSIARPEGDSQLVRGQVAVSVFDFASRRTMEFLLSILSKTTPFPSATGNSGLPGSAMVATTLRVAVSITDTSLLRPLNAHTVFVTGSNTIPSGFVPTGIEASVLRLERSKT